MFSEESDHLEGLRLRPVLYPDDPCTSKPRLHCPGLLELLQETQSSKERSVQDAAKSKSKHVAVKQKNKKRAREAEPDSGVRKRAKVSLDDVISISDEDEDRSFHAYRRVFRLRYTRAVVHEHEERLEVSEWLEEEMAVRDWLSSLVLDHPNESTIDLGPVSVQVELIETGKTWARTPQGSFILGFPTPRSSFHPEHYDFPQRSHGTKSSSIRELLQAFQVLAQHGRARIDSRLFLDLTPDSLPDELPFTLRLQVDCSFICPQVFKSTIFYTKAEAASMSEVQDALRRLTVYLFPPQIPIPTSYHGHTDIPFLFSILKPAPPLPSPKAHDALQPESLLPTLLPFQRRTVGWMLTREGKAIAAAGNIITRADVDEDQRPLPLFWDRFPVSDEETWYVNRLRGIISPTRPTGEEDEPDGEALGGIVAEEPGLGKTLECISAIIMNPGVGRSPANKRWDSAAKIDVKEIKVRSPLPLGLALTDVLVCFDRRLSL